MTVATLDLVKLAMEHVLTITDAIDKYIEVKNKQEEEKKKEDSKKGLRGKLRSRARELPSLILGSGLVNALLFYLSKSSQGAYNESTKILKCGNTIQDNPKLEDNNDYAYALTARAILCALKELSYIDQDIDSMKSAITALLALKDREIQAVADLEEYLLSYKRAAEALWEKEE